MKYFILIVIGFFVGFCIITRRDFGRDRDLRDYLIGTHSWSIIGHENILSRNIEKTIGHWKKVSASVRDVRVTKTMDTDCYVIELISKEGESASLWLNSDGTLRTITSY